MKYCCVINHLWLIHASLFCILPTSKLVPLHKKSCIIKVLWLGFTSPCLFLCLFVACFVLFWGVPLIDITCVFLFMLSFLSSHAFTVSFGICQHLPSGENSLQVAVCVCSKTNHGREANTGCDNCSEIRVIWKDPEAVCGLWGQDASSLFSGSDTVQMRSDKWLGRSELGLAQ